MRWKPSAVVAAFEVNFFFDHSSGHDMGDEQALVARRLNKTSGGSTLILLRPVCATTGQSSTSTRS